MIKIITDSVASIPADIAHDLNIEVITLYVSHNGREYEDSKLDLEAFYSDMDSMIQNMPTSSQPSQKSFEDSFAQAARNGDEVLGIFMSSGLSGTYEGAIKAAKAVKGLFPEFRCILIDSASCGYDEAWAVYEAAAARDEGKSLAECAFAAHRAVRSTRFLFTPKSLTFLQKGGRIGAARALLGNLVHLAPVLTVIDGCSATFAKVRSRKRALEKIVQALSDDIESHGLKRIIVHYIGDVSPALRWCAEAIEPLTGKKVDVRPVSPVIGLHVGPAIGIAYECMTEIMGKLSGVASNREFAV
ncbi:MAG: DegV family protein [Eggerthellaceae bacterium]|nr:DegV family protein [Eggerthellaceae bacterium]